MLAIRGFGFEEVKVGGLSIWGPLREDGAPHEWFDHRGIEHVDKLLQHLLVPEVNIRMSGPHHRMSGARCLSPSFSGDW